MISTAEQLTHSGPATQYTSRADAEDSKRYPKLNKQVREYVYNDQIPTDAGIWITSREVPTSREIGGHPGTTEGDAVSIPSNKIHKPWRTRESYFMSHYELLKEDTVAPLRGAVAKVKNNKDKKDDQQICVYENVSSSLPPRLRQN